MSRSTFSGPILAGVDDSSFVESLNPIVIKTGPNWGFLKMAQSASITQTEYPTNLYPSTSEMTMVIPGLSTITRISVLVTTAFTGVMDIGQVWISPGAGGHIEDLVKDLVLTAVGMTVVGPGDTDDLVTNDIRNWMNNSADVVPTTGDRCIAQASSTAGSGVGVLTVEYSQAVNLEAIA